MFRFLLRKARRASPREDAMRPLLSLSKLYIVVIDTGLPRNLSCRVNIQYLCFPYGDTNHIRPYVLKLANFIMSLRNNVVSSAISKGPDDEHCHIRIV